MEEAKLRIASIDAAINGRCGLHDMMAEEFGYLQLRLLCEIIALGCLVAHGDITRLNLDKLSREYNADAMIKNLEKLHAEFYPHPVVMTVVPRISVHMEPNKSGFLTKQELLSLYGRTGNYLHRGKLKTLKSKPPYTHVDLPLIAQWNQKIIELLTTHHIRSFDNKQHWLCILKNADDNNHVQVALAKAP